MSFKPRRVRDRILNEYVKELQNSDYFQLSFKTSLNKCLEYSREGVTGIVCYGLGSFYDGVHISSRYQLALLILTHQLLAERNQSIDYVIEIYDPSFEQADLDTLASFQKPEFKIISTNEHCARTFSDLVLVYMPHLDKFLYNNVLGSNWTEENLAKVVVLGNSFQEMIDCETETVCRAQLYYLYTLVRNFNISRSSNNKKSRRDKYNHGGGVVLEETPKLLVEIPIDDSSFHHLDIFNSLSFHILRREWLRDNSHRIRESILKDWTPTTSCDEPAIDG